MKNGKGFITVAILCGLLSCGSIIKPYTVLAQDTLATRLSGDNRYLTSVAISQKGWAQANTVILASGLDFPDALSASALSKSKDAPILLTDNNSLQTETLEEIQRLKATQIIIVGGTGVISAYVESQLTNLGFSVTRIGGVDRYDTSKQVANLLSTSNGIIIASGSDFPDALSIASVAGIKSMPILLSPQASLDANIDGFIAGKSIPVSYIVGGTGALSSTIDSAVPGSKRLSGDNRYATNLAVLNQFPSDLNFDTVYIVSGDNFPDALCGAALAEKNNAPVLLTGTSSMSQDTINFLKIHNVKQVVILGGTGAISTAVEVSINSQVLNTSTVIDKTPAISLYDSLKAVVVSNLESRTTNFDFQWKGTKQECEDAANKIMKDIEYTDAYEYYNMDSMNLTVSEGVYSGITNTTLDFVMGYRDTKEQEAYVSKQVDDIVPKLINSSMTTANKELAIHDWIVNNVQYDDSLTKYTAYNALASHSATCEGYALLTYKMLIKAGIECKIVAGTANNGTQIGSHAWNLANIDGKWYHIDTTWDDPKSSRGAQLVHNYFNLTDAQISKDHFWDKTMYPTVTTVPFIK